jgi:hypothetical protein
MTVGPNWLQGQPELGYTRYLVYAGQDVLLQLTFLNSLGVQTQPTSIVYEMDDLTNGQNMIPAGTALAPSGGGQQVLQITAAQLVMDRQYQGRQISQVWITAVIPDTNAPSGSITVQQAVIIETVAIATAQGTSNS